MSSDLNIWDSQFRVPLPNGISLILLSLNFVLPRYSRRDLNGSSGHHRQQNGQRNIKRKAGNSNRSIKRYMRLLKPPTYCNGSLLTYSRHRSCHRGEPGQQGMQSHPQLHFQVVHLSNKRAIQATPSQIWYPDLGRPSRLRHNPRSRHAHSRDQGARVSSLL